MQSYKLQILQKMYAQFNRFSGIYQRRVGIMIICCHINIQDNGCL